jgi:hypothetical protein
MRVAILLCLSVLVDAVQPWSNEPHRERHDVAVKTVCTGSSSGLPAAECAGWVALFDATNGTGWKVCQQQRTDPCSCGIATGAIGCRENHITRISLSSNNLQGTLVSATGTMIAPTERTERTEPLLILLLFPPSFTPFFPSHPSPSSEPSGIAQMDHLITFSAYSNSINGTLPRTIGMIGRLETLALESNGLTGSIPAEVAQLTNLQIMVRELRLDASHALVAPSSKPCTCSAKPFALANP